MFLPRLRAYSSLIGIVAGTKNGSRTNGCLTNSGSDAGLTTASGISIQKLETQATRLKARCRCVYCGGRATQVRHWQHHLDYSLRNHKEQRECVYFLPPKAGRRLKGCTARIVPNHSAFRKRNQINAAMIFAWAFAANCPA